MSKMPANEPPAEAARVGAPRRTSTSARGRPRRSGRRAGDGGTRDAILGAAREQFGQSGYAGTTIRSIAAAAGVDPALVLHFFGSKDALFALCLAFPEDVVDRFAESLTGPVGTVGERVTRFYFALWEEPVSGDPLRVMIRSAASNDEAARVMREFVSTQLVGRVMRARTRDQGELRATLVGAQLVGVMFLRHIVEIEPLASLPLDDLVTYVAPSVQRYLAGDL